MFRTNFVYVEGCLVSYEERQVGKSTLSRMRLRLPTGKKADKPTSCFIDVDAWDLPDDLKATLNENQNSKGRFSVQGEFRMDEWEDKKTKAKRSKVYIRATKIFYDGAWKKDEAPAGVSSNDSGNEEENVSF